MEYQKPIPPDQKILDILLEAMKDEAAAAARCLTLQEMAEKPADKEILRQIRMTGQKHSQLFQTIYKKLTGDEAIIEEPSDASYRAGELLDEYGKSLFTALEVSEFYRKIYFGFADSEIRDMIFEMITDEQNIAIQYNYLSSQTRKIF